MSDPLSEKELADAREFGTYERDTFVRLLATIDTLQAENARLREQAEALAAALARENLEAAGFECYPNVCKRCGHKGGEHDIYDKCLACSSCQTFASMDENERWEYALAALRAYREATP